MSLLDKLTTTHTFPDGARVSLLHKYALRYESGGRSVEVGFEQALEPAVDRLIHENSIVSWVGPAGETSVTIAERTQILARLEEYCRAKGLTYRVVRDPTPPRA